MQEIRVKRIMLAAPRSGSGKTTMTCALLKALQDRGLAPASFKCGPDYIDPLFHGKVLGIKSRNLDTYFAGTEGVQEILANCQSEYAVIDDLHCVISGDLLFILGKSSNLSFSIFSLIPSQSVLYRLSFLS